MLALAACGGSERPVYSGHEESTAGVPGFSADGKRKLHPNVKLGQSYRVMGKTYVPRYQPDYDEEGIASWYGPGFHGGRTANGETFSTHQYTAAHTTLPMPSIVKVTYLKTGKSAFVRINDRGPFAQGRIIDLSKAAADDIGLSRDGIGRVRVQYMPEESWKFVEMITKEGRDPQSIDIANEVIGKKPNGEGEMLFANTTPPDDSIEVTDTMDNGAPTTTTNTPAAGSIWDHVSPISSAQAAEPPPVLPAPTPAPEQAPAGIVTPVGEGSLPSGTSVKVDPIGNNTAVVTPVAPPPQAVAGNTGATAPPSAAAAMPPASLPLPHSAPPPEFPPENAPPPTATVNTGPYIQLGAFANQNNAVALQQRFASLGATSIVPGNAGGIPVYRVRLGPFLNEEAATEILERAKQMGVGDAKLVTAYH